MTPPDGDRRTHGAIGPSTGPTPVTGSEAAARRLSFLSQLGLPLSKRFAVRRSTVVLAVLFLGLGGWYLVIKPSTPAGTVGTPASPGATVAPATTAVPPGTSVPARSTPPTVPASTTTRPPSATTTTAPRTTTTVRPGTTATSTTSTSSTTTTSTSTTTTTTG